MSDLFESNLDRFEEQFERQLNRIEELLNRTEELERENAALLAAVHDLERLLDLHE